jgi:hypothetical protein
MLDFESKAQRRARVKGGRWVLTWRLGLACVAVTREKTRLERTDWGGEAESASR